MAAVDTLVFKQNNYLRGDVLKSIFVGEIYIPSIHISWKFVPRRPFNP